MELSVFHFRLFFYMLTCTLPLLVAAADTTEPVKAEVELLIICDKEFFGRFHNDRQKMIDYWKVYMWDVSMKFKTLTFVDMSFRVTSLITIDNTDDQPFIEQARKLNGRIALDDVEKEFQSWLYANENRLTGFDVALLVTSADPIEDDLSLSSKVGEKTVCLKSHSEKLIKSSIVLHSSGTWGNECNGLDSSLASMLGAPSEKSACLEEPSECDEYYYAMSDSNCNSGQYFFSHCSDKGIAKLLSSPQGACLREEAAPGMDVLKFSKVTHAPSLEDQCTMVTRSNKSTPIKGLNDCVEVKCRFETSDLDYRSLIPLDNSPCDKEKVCFRGRCLPQGHLLRNVATGKCLRSRNRFSANDQPEMMDCEESIATPMDKIMVYEKGAYKKFLATPILKQDKCLSSDPLEFRYLQYYECSPESEMLFSWDLMKVGHGGEFLLLHLHTMKCARVTENEGPVELVSNCDKRDARMRWIFVDSPVSTLGWFDNFDHFRKAEKCPL